MHTFLIRAGPTFIDHSPKLITAEILAVIVISITIGLHTKHIPLKVAIRLLDDIDRFGSAIYGFLDGLIRPNTNGISSEVLKPYTRIAIESGATLKFSDNNIAIDIHPILRPLLYFISLTS